MMKVFRFSLWVCLLLIGLAGCSSNGPESVAKAFMEAMYNGEFEEAEKLCEPNSQKGVVLIARMTPPGRVEMMKKEGPITITVNKSEIQKDEESGEKTATVNLTIKTSKEEKKQEVYLVQQEGEWRIVLKQK